MAGDSWGQEGLRTPSPTHGAILSEFWWRSLPAGGGQPVSQRAVGLLGLKDKGRRGQGKELVAESLMVPKKNIKLENYGET